MQRRTHGSPLSTCSALLRRKQRCHNTSGGTGALVRQTHLRAPLHASPRRALVREEQRGEQHGARQVDEQRAGAPLLIALLERLS